MDYKPIPKSPIINTDYQICGDLIIINDSFNESSGFAYNSAMMMECPSSPTMEASSSSSVTSITPTLRTSAQATSENSRRRSNSLNIFSPIRTRARTSMLSGSPIINTAVVEASTSSTAQIMTGNNVTVKPNDVRSTRSKLQAPTSTALTSSKTSGSQARASTSSSSLTSRRAGMQGRASTSSNSSQASTSSSSSQSSTSSSLPQAATSSISRKTVVAPSRVSKAQTKTGSNISVRLNDVRSTRSQLQASTSTSSTSTRTSGTQARASTSTSSPNLRKAALKNILQFQASTSTASTSSRSSRSSRNQEQIVSMFPTNASLSTRSPRTSRQASTSTISALRTSGPSTSRAVQQKIKPKKTSTITTRSEARASTSTSSPTTISSEQKSRKRTTVDCQMESADETAEKYRRVAKSIRRISEEAPHSEHRCRNIICPVCFIELNSLDEKKKYIINVGECGHVFCNDCAIIFAAKTGKCPMCNAGIIVSNFRRIFLDFE